MLEHIDHFFLHPVRKASARAEVGHLQLRQFLAAGIRRQPIELAVQLLAGLFEDHGLVAVAVTHFADDGQHRHFKQDHMQPRPAQADKQLAVLDAGLHITQVEAE